ncbi:MAG: hypothetical protein C4567_01535 [Deltaproteobacteria bacterium]|nr:MAG: hypothetical protein C4567_01535 [Deltaproteobacteria bacterium]
MDMKAYDNARKAILKDAAGAKGVKGKISCPACKTGTLFYEIMRNGRVCTQCNTTGCLAWMK